jgi:predicted esterase
MEKGKLSEPGDHYTRTPPAGRELLPMRKADDDQDPHANQPTLTQGPVPEEAQATLVLLHGRGGTAEDILSLHDQLALPDVAALAPQAANCTWYPHSFLAPVQANQPCLDSAFRRVESIVAGLIERGVANERIALLGFSQGACLAAEYVARHPRRYGAVILLTGGLIGPPGTLREYAGSLRASPVFLGSSDPDPHVPFERVQETQRVLEQMGAKTQLRRYPGMPHTINSDELDAARALIDRMLPS